MHTLPSRRSFSDDLTTYAKGWWPGALAVRYKANFLYPSSFLLVAALPATKTDGTEHYPSIAHVGCAWLYVTGNRPPFQSQNNYRQPPTLPPRESSKHPLVNGQQMLGPGERACFRYGNKDHLQTRCEAPRSEWLAWWEQSYLRGMVSPASRYLFTKQRPNHTTSPVTIGSVVLRTVFGRPSERVGRSLDGKPVVLATC